MIAPHGAVPLEQHFILFRFALICCFPLIFRTVNFLDHGLPYGEFKFKFIINVLNMGTLSLQKVVSDADILWQLMKGVDNEFPMTHDGKFYYCKYNMISFEC